MPKILIIEDEKSIQRMIAYDLKQLNYEVESAMDGFEGYKKASTFHYDVILLDLMLPNMNGMDICKKLRDEGSITFTQPQKKIILYDHDSLLEYLKSHSKTSF
jgi:two-component system alkaline phosphatase synthesis response regulator PhoP